MKFLLLDNMATNSTSHSNGPAVKINYGTSKVTTRNSYNIETLSRPSGTATSFELKASDKTSLKYF
jgi:hypothetical protein